MLGRGAALRGEMTASVFSYVCSVPSDVRPSTELQTPCVSNCPRSIHPRSSISLLPVRPLEDSALDW